MRDAADWKPPVRIATALHHTAFALTELRRDGDSYQLSEDVATIWRRRLGPRERSLMLAAAIKACEPRDAVFLRDVLNDILDDTEVPQLGV